MGHHSHKPPGAVEDAQLVILSNGRCDYSLRIAAKRILQPMLVF